MSKDFYSMLGINKDATEDDIRRAYKKIALKDHPDRNPGDKAAEERFKAANEAYSVLNDPQKRAQYDRGGMNSMSGGFGGFSGFDDMFAEIFGVRHQTRQQNGPLKGNDISVQTQISLREAMMGCKKELSIEIPEVCNSCSGTGAHNANSFVSCNACGGSGNIREVMGTMMFSQTCNRCGGRGKTIDKKCSTCNARGQISKIKKINVGFPAGINTGNNLKVAGQGQASPNGGQPGDVYVVVDVAEDKKFKRVKSDLVTQLNLSISEAILGTKKDISLPDDTIVNVSVSPGSQPNHIISVDNAGMPDVRSTNVRGKLYVELNVEIPRYISEKAAELIKLFEEETKNT